MSTSPTALITVRTRCTCEAERWYQCRCPHVHVVAEYDCPLFDDIPNCPCPSAVVEVESRHPGHDLLYMGFGQVHLDYVKKERERRAKEKARG